MKVLGFFYTGVTLADVNKARAEGGARDVADDMLEKGLHTKATHAEAIRQLTEEEWVNQQGGPVAKNNLFVKVKSDFISTDVPSNSIAISEEEARKVWGDDLDDAVAVLEAAEVEAQVEAEEKAKVKAEAEEKAKAEAEEKTE